MPPARLRAFDALASKLPFVMPLHLPDHDPECTLEHFAELGGLPVENLPRYVVDDQVKQYRAGERRDISRFNRVRVPSSDGAVWLDFVTGPKRTVGVLALRTTAADLINAPFGPGERVREEFGDNAAELPGFKFMHVAFDGEKVTASPWTLFVVADEQFITAGAWWFGETERLAEVQPEGPDDETILDIEAALYALAVVDCTTSTFTERKAPPAKEGGPTRLSASKVRTGEELLLDEFCGCFSPCGHHGCVAVHASVSDKDRPKLARALERTRSFHLDAAGNDESSS